MSSLNQSHVTMVEDYLSRVRTKTETTYMLTVARDGESPVRTIIFYSNAIEAAEAYNMYQDWGFAKQYLTVSLYEPSGKINTKVFKRNQAGDPTFLRQNYIDITDVLNGLKPFLSKEVYEDACVRIMTSFAKDNWRFDSERFLEALGLRETATVADKYKEFYFLHIPKAGGRSFKTNIVLPIAWMLDQNGISIVRSIDKEGTSHHGQWADGITESSFIACTFRDPVRHMVSLFSHSMTLDGHGELLSDARELSKEDFFLWVDANRTGLENFQSRHIASSNTHGLERIRRNPETVGPLDRDLVFKRIKRINMFLKLEDIDLAADGIDSIKEAILKELGLGGLVANSRLRAKSATAKSFHNPFSENLYNLLTSSEIDDLSHISPVDSEIHETSSLFWRK